MNPPILETFKKLPYYKTLPIDLKINEKYIEVRFRLNTDKLDFGWSNAKLPKTDRVR